MNKNKKIKAVIFDYDGVLVDSLDAGIEAYQKIANHFMIKGFDAKEEFRRANLSHYQKILAEWGLNDTQITEAHTIYVDVHKNHRHINLIPKIRSVIDTLGKEYVLAIASGTRRAIIGEKLKSEGLEHHFNVVVTNDDVKNFKPAPDLLNLCRTRLGLKTSEVIFVGDMVLDIEMGKAAGIKTVILCSHSWNEREALKERKPDMMIDNVEELLELL